MADGWYCNGALATGLNDEAWLTDRHLNVNTPRCSTEIPLSVLKYLLETRGLHIVTSADKKVLDACRDAQITCPPDCYPDFVNPHPVAIAECARRRESTKA
jgi:hypothetical protein